MIEFVVQGLIDEKGNDTSMLALFGLKLKPVTIFSKSATILSSLALSPNKSRGWFFEMMLLLQVLQTSLRLEKHFVCLCHRHVYNHIISGLIVLYVISQSKQALQLEP